MNLRILWRAARNGVLLGLILGLFAAGSVAIRRGRAKGLLLTGASVCLAAACLSYRQNGRG